MSSESIDQIRAESFGVERAYLLTHEALAGLRWFQELDQASQAQALEQAVVDITSKFKGVDQQIGDNRTWSLFQARLGSIGKRGIEALERDWAGKFRFANFREQNHPLGLVYVAMRDGLETVAEAKTKLFQPPPRGIGRKMSFDPGKKDGATRHFTNNWR